MESNEQTELTSKTDRLIEGEQMTASGGGTVGWEVRGLSKKVMNMGKCGDFWGVEV